MPSDSSRERLPFEPQQKKKKVTKKSTSVEAEKSVSNSKQKNSAYDADSASLSAIPDEVSNKMIKRAIFFSGVPTVMGISSFFVFYFIVKQEWFEVPNYAALLVSMGLFGLGVLGLSYGILSTSWDVGREGGLLGWNEFTLNFGRMTSAWKSARKESLEKNKKVSND